MQQIRALARRKTLVAACTIVIGALVLIGSWAVGTQAPPPAIEQEQPLAADIVGEEAFAEPAAPTAAATVIVYVSGAVRAPDVYQLPAEARVKDLVLAAGGLAPDADAERINLAERLADGGHVHVPRQGQAQPESVGAAEAAAPGQSTLVNVNTAAAAELDELPGIGQAIAERIVEYRGANGPFKTVEDLRNVKGIGPALFSKIAPLVTVGP